MDSLLAKLSEQQGLLAKQKTALSGTPEVTKQMKHCSSNSSILLTPASETFSSPVGDRQETLRIEMAEMSRLKKELDDAKQQIARQKHELDQSRVVKHTFDLAMDTHSDAGLSPPPFASSGAFTTSRRPPNPIQGPWRAEDPRHDSADVIIPINNASNAWSGASRPNFPPGLQSTSTWGQQNSRTWGQRGIDNTLPALVMSEQPPMQQRNYSVPLSPAGGRRGLNDFDQYNPSRSFGQTNRNTSVFQQSSGWNGLSAPQGPLDGMNLGGMNPGSAYQTLGFSAAYQPQPIGTPLSPTATEFRANQASSNPWNSAASVSQFRVTHA